MASSSVDLNEYNGGALMSTSVALLALTYFSVLLRTYVRGWLTKGFLADDWLMLVSQVVFTLSCAFIIIGTTTGLGRHNEALEQDAEIDALMWQALATASYVLNMMFIKLSIAVFLLRISSEKKYLWTIWISAFVVLVWSLVIFFWNVFQCSPVEAQWDYRLPDKKCVSSEEIVSAAYAISVMTILTDWLYALMPIPMIWKVKMTKQAKATVVVILSLGVFASIATLVRLKFLADLNDTADILYAGTDAMVWTLIEPGVAIVASSLVTIRPLLRKMRLPGFMSTENSRMKSGPTGYGYGRSRTGTNPLRSGTHPSNGRPPAGLDPNDVTLTDLEAANSPFDGRDGTDPKKIGIVTTTISAGTNGIRRTTSTRTYPALSPTDTVVGSTKRVVVNFDDKALPPTPASPLEPPQQKIKGQPPARISVRSEMYIIEGKMIGEPPTPSTPMPPTSRQPTDSPRVSGGAEATTPPLPRLQPPQTPLSPARSTAASSLHSEDQETAETYSQHDGKVGLGVRPDWR